MKKYIPVIICLLLCVGGILMAVFTHGGAMAEGASDGSKAAFAVSVIVAVAGLAGAVANLMPERRQADARMLAMASVFAALCYVGCTYFKIPIPGSTSFFHPIVKEATPYSSPPHPCCIASAGPHDSDSFLWPSRRAKAEGVNFTQVICLRSCWRPGRAPLGPFHYSLLTFT